MNAFWWAILAALIWGITSVVEKVVLVKTEVLPGLFYRSIGVLIGMIILTAFMLRPAQIKAVDPRSALLLVAAGFMGSFIAFIAFYKGLKLGEVSLVVPVAGSFYLVSFILGILLLGEAITPLKVLAVSLITVGIWMLGAGM